MGNRLFNHIELGLAEVTAGGVFAHAFSTFSRAPAWLTGSVSALVVGVILRVADATLRTFGERLRHRVLPGQSAFPPPPDDDATDD